MAAVGPQFGRSPSTTVQAVPGAGSRTNLTSVTRPEHLVQLDDDSTRSTTPVM